MKERVGASKTVMRSAIQHFMDQQAATAQTQAALLETMVCRNRDTAFGTEHGFRDIRGIGDYRRQVPIRQWTEISPYIDNPANQAWRASLLAYRSQMQSALDTLDAADLPAEWRPVVNAILKNNVAFMDACAEKGAITMGDIQDFAKLQGPNLKKVVAWAAQTQVEHWMTVIGDWKAMLGADWDKTYAASNSIYVTRQNNVLFSVLAQFFGADAINDRLLLIETISFTTTPADMLESLTRIIADRSVGAIFFGNYKLMDFELMGGDARVAIIAEDRKRGIAPLLPPAVPFGSHQWPGLVTPGAGPTSLADLP